MRSEADTFPVELPPGTPDAVRQRLALLALAARLGNVAQACRDEGVDRSAFYEWQRRYRAAGLAGLADLPSKPKTSPQRTPPAITARILALALEHPEWGCGRAAEQLKAEGTSVSSPTVQSLWIAHGLGGIAARMAALEAEHLRAGRPLVGDQALLLAKQNPAFRERLTAPARPGEWLVQESFLVGDAGRLGKIYLHAVVDAWNAQAFGLLFAGKRSAVSVAVLHNDVLPAYARHGVQVRAILTDRSWEFERHPYPLYLDLNEISHHLTDVRGPRKHGAFERFHEEVRDEFFKPTLAGHGYWHLAELQQAFDGWLLRYNTQRPSPGFPNWGRPPAQVLAAWSGAPTT